MRRLIAIFAVSSLVIPALMATANAAAVAGFEALYEAVLSACTPPAGTMEACEAAINGYAAAMVAAGVDPTVALQSFTELRAEVLAAGGSAPIDGLFEELLPQSGSVERPVVASPS